MMFTDAYVLYKACHAGTARMDSKTFFAELADELIDIKIDNEGKSTRAETKQKHEDSQINRINQCRI